MPSRERLARQTPEQAQRAREAMRQYREKNRERLLDYYREYNATHSEKRTAATKAWRAANPDKRAAQQRRRNGALIEGDLTSNAWVQVLEDFDRSCAYCGASGKLTLDHIVPVSKGGPHSVSNVAPACSRCNESKNARDLLPWLLDANTPGSVDTLSPLLAHLLP